MDKTVTVRQTAGYDGLHRASAQAVAAHAAATGSGVERQSQQFDDGWIDRTLISRFELIAAQFPEKLALDDGRLRLTYREVLNAARDLAQRIEAVAPVGKPVGIFLPNGALFPVAALACLAAGRIYVPIDLNYPAERNVMILREAGLAAAICDPAHAASCASLGDLPSLNITQSFGSAGHAHATAPISADGPAVVLYTSGSTGRPKGICNDQKAILQRVAQFTRTCELNGDDRFLLLSSPGTIAGVRDTFAALLNGASLYIADPQQAGIGGILGACRDHRITVVYGVPALMREIFRQPAAREACRDIRILRLGGDAILASDIALCRGALPASARILVGYGSTEVPTVFQWFVPVDWTPDGSTVPCGHASPDVGFSMLAESGAEAAPGELAEVVVRSRYVALGLWQDGQLQTDTFETDPADPAVRVMRTGDLVRLRANGLADLIGRKDRQIKVRGLRVDLGDIEAALRGCADVLDVAVVSRRIEGTDVLSAYVVARDPASASLHEQLDDAKKTLPLHMRPARIHVVSAIPRLPGYKPDIKLLEQMEAVVPAAPARPLQQRAAPATELESQMLAIWRQLLNSADLGVTESFFDAGGNSLMAMELTLAIEAQLGREISLETVFSQPTVRTLCASMTENATCNPAVVLPVRSGVSGAVLYFIHSGFEFAAISNALPRSLSTAFVTTNSLKWLRGITRSGDVLAAVDRISDAYAQAIHARREAGPIYLAGHSFGGILAVETARKLEALGAAPAHVFLFDTYLHGSLHRILHDIRHNGWLARKLGEFINGNRREIARRARFLAGTALRRMLGFVTPKRSSAPAAATANTETDLQQLFRALREEGSQAYQGPAHALASRIVLFQATRTVDGRTLCADPDPGWAKPLQDTFTVIPAAGDHYSLLTGGRAGFLAAEMARCMGQARDAQPSNITRTPAPKQNDRYYDHTHTLAA